MPIFSPSEALIFLKKSSKKVHFFVSNIWLTHCFCVSSCHERSEKRAENRDRRAEDSNQLKLAFDGMEQLPEEDQKPSETEITITYTRKAEPRKKPVREAIPDHLPWIEEVIEPEFIPEGAVRIGEEVTEKMEYIPGKMVVRRIVRPKYALPQGEGVLVASKVSFTDESNDQLMLPTVNYYDTYGRVVQTISKNQKEGYDANSMGYYGLTSQVTDKLYNHNAWFNNEMCTYEEGSSYTFDHALRLEQAQFSFNENLICQSLYSYNLLGQNREKNIVESDILQSIDYEYTIQGWLKKINNPSISTPGESPTDLFGMELFYSDDDAGLGNKLQYNGNISGVKWQTAQLAGKMAYRFIYDELNRLLDAEFLEEAGSSWNLSNKFSERALSYDNNGNILSLDRHGLLTPNGSEGRIDQFNAYYYFGNQLIGLNDENLAPNGEDFYDNGSRETPVQTNLETWEYHYDDNGNMIMDKNKGILDINYNHLNLPCEIIFQDNNRIKYFYDAAGIKRRKEVYLSGSLSSAIDYLAKVVYEDGNPSYALFDEGRVLIDPEETNYIEYHLKDHLGNVRVVFKDNQGTPQTLQTNAYYPFGATIPSLSYQYNTYSNKLKYNGKEFQGDLKLDWYDYGARMYDAQLGRWHVVDPLAHKYYQLSPYCYVANNPIKFIDPDGQKIVLAGTAAERQVSLTHLQKLTNDKLSIRKDGTLIITKLGGENSSKTLNTGTNLIRDLNKKDAGSKTMTISIGTPGSGNSESDKNSANAINGKGSDVTVNFDPSANPSIPTKDPVTGNVSGATRPDEIGLAHEMVHGERSMDGKATNYSTTDTHTYTDAAGNTVTQTVPKEELQTVGLKGNNPNDYNENKIRTEQGLNERGAY